MSKKSAAGSGTIRQRPDGRWEARFTFVDDLGQTKRKSIYGDTQKEVRQRLAVATAEVDRGTFRETKRYSLSEWFNVWIADYGVDWKPNTAIDYRKKAERHILPALGKVQLSALSPVQVQRFVNRLSEPKGDAPGLSAKTVKNLHGILHSCLKDAVAAGILPRNPADNIKLPKVRKAELGPIMDSDLGRFMEACKGEEYGLLFLLDLFTGMRQSEIIGLQWGDIDFEAATIHVCRQLQKSRERDEYIFVTPKNGKSRLIPFPPSVGAILKRQRTKQARWKLVAGPAWNNPNDLVFTGPTGEHMKHRNVQKHFRKLCDSIGLPNTRFHDLRHSCAIMGLQSGCSIKAVSDMLGHYSSSFTMDVYADVSKTMMDDTRNRMEALFKAASNG